jgi:hypothetical protein
MTDVDKTGRESRIDARRFFAGEDGDRSKMISRF